MNENLTWHEESEDGNEIRSEIELNGGQERMRMMVQPGSGEEEEEVEDKGNDYSVKSSCCHYSFEYFSHHHHHWNHGQQNEPIQERAERSYPAVGATAVRPLLLHSGQSEGRATLEQAIRVTS